MGDEIFTGSDSLRTAAPLKHAQYVVFAQPLHLEQGGLLEQVRVAYETYGQLSAQRDNAVLLCHALSGDSHVASHDQGDDPGWWELAVGPGKHIDTDRYFVICPNILGGCRGTTGPNSVNPATQRPYGPAFPAITIGDMVNLQQRLIDHLGIETLLAAIGGSMGGMQVLHWAVAYPGRVRAAIPIATAPRLTSQGLAFDVIGRNAITRDPNFNGGDYYDLQAGAVQGVYLPRASIGGLALARMIGHITYLSREAMRAKFEANRNQPWEVESAFEKDTSVASYLAHQGDRFVERFDANSYIAISRAMDFFDLGEGPALVARLGGVQSRFLVLSFASDWLFPPDQSQEMVRALVASNKPVSYCNVASPRGHDAFLLEHELDVYGGLMAGFLATARNGKPAGEEPEEDAQGQVQHADTSIYQGRRLDYDFLEDLIVKECSEPAPGVLDLGCGGGQLLLRLKHQGWHRLLGVERDQSAVLACVRRGVDVIHADLNEGLPMFADRQFDVVLLSRTLQAVYNVDRVVADMLRVGKRCIVSFPNFAYQPLRKMLAQEGRAPEAFGLLRYKWHDTPNIRFLSIADFQDYCAGRKIAVHRLVALNTESRVEVPLDQDPNLNADLAIFVLSRK